MYAKCYNMEGYAGSRFLKNGQMPKKHNLVVQLICTEKVAGSMPAFGSKPSQIVANKGRKHVAGRKPVIVAYGREHYKTDQLKGDVRFIQAALGLTNNQWMDKGPVSTVAPFSLYLYKLSCMHTLLLILAGFGISYLIERGYELYIKYRNNGK